MADHPGPTAGLPRRPDRPGDERRATAAPIDLLDLATRSSPEGERQCPACGRLDRPAGPEALTSTIAPGGSTCAACGRQWRETHGPRPDVVVLPDPGRTT